MRHLNITEAAQRCEVPVLFIHGDKDDFIVPAHAEKNYEAYKGDNKRLLIFDGTHNTQRPEEVTLEVLSFLR